MGTPIDIWLVGNTGLRNPNRIKDGFSVFAESSFVGNLRGRENDIAFMNLLNEKGIILSRVLLVIGRALKFKNTPRPKNSNPTRPLFPPEKGRQMRSISFLRNLQTVF